MLIKWQNLDAVFQPYRYFHHMLKELPGAQSLKDIGRLLSWRVDKDLLTQDEKWVEGL